ncbi:MAG: short-chain fatty acid transporter [Flavobacteriales bacterium]|nr:short-chain fatty acid transporter [Bacteroidota bacterium]MCB9239593.1 short-chain fatty acid transporter [Flavobacteriales bacterium]
MSSFTKSYLKFVQRVLPSPLTIAVVLTALTAVLALVFTQDNSIVDVGMAWQKGFWELLSFTMQMMIMLVLGHTLALSKPSGLLIDWITSRCTSSSAAVVMVSLFSVIAGLVNWGLGLIFGAILARKVGEHCRRQHIRVSYGLLGTCGYLSLLVWHGGLSGSAPLTVAKAGHSMEALMGVVPVSSTLLAMPNILASIGVLIALPLTAHILNRLIKPSKSDGLPKLSGKPSAPKKAKGAERLDHTSLLGIALGLMMLGLAFREMLQTDNALGYFNLDTINFILFGFALLFHGSLFSFTQAAERAIRGTTGILIQFPLYAGIMGIMKYSGLLLVFAEFFTEISTAQSFPFFAYLSSSIVNILVPSGGGQWQVQGPILLEAAKTLGVNPSKVVMALAYGDQLTNMLQPFWALPLLGITGLKAKHILPYSALFMLLAGSIYLLVLYLL